MRYPRFVSLRHSVAIALPLAWMAATGAAQTTGTTPSADEQIREWVRLLIQAEEQYLHNGADVLSVDSLGPASAYFTDGAQVMSYAPPRATIATPIEDAPEAAEEEATQEGPAEEEATREEPADEEATPEAATQPEGPPAAAAEEPAEGEPIEATATEESPTSEAPADAPAAAPEEDESSVAAPAITTSNPPQTGVRPEPPRAQPSNDVGIRASLSRFAWIVSDLASVVAGVIALVVLTAALSWRAIRRRQRRARAATAT